MKTMFVIFGGILVTVLAILADIYFFHIFWHRRHEMFRSLSFRQKWSNRPRWQLPVLVAFGIPAGLLLAYLAIRSLKEGTISGLAFRIVGIVFTIYIARTLKKAWSKNDETDHG